MKGSGCFEAEVGENQRLKLRPPVAVSNGGRCLELRGQSRAKAPVIATLTEAPEAPRVRHILFTLYAFRALCHRSSESAGSVFFSFMVIFFVSGGCGNDRQRRVHTADADTELLTWKAHLRTQTPPEITHLVFIMTHAFHSCSAFLHEPCSCSIFMLEISIL